MNGKQTNSDAAEGISAHPYTRYADLAGKTVLVTGGSSGIGAYLSHAFLQQGCNVAILSLDEAAGQRFCNSCAATLGRQPYFQTCDLSDVSALRAAVANAEAQFGAMNILVNNAARDDRHDVMTLEPHDWDRLMNVNLRPHYFTVQAVLPGMRKQGGGSIINLGSNSANLGLAGYPAYVTAKNAIVGLTRALARELGSAGIRVNTLIPGWVMTERQKTLWVTDAALQQCLADQCLPVALTGEDIAEPALFLASAASKMMTGQSVIVDGGRALR